MVVISIQEANNIVDFVLGGVDIVLFFAAVFQLVRLIRGSKALSMNFTAKKAFHAVIVVLLLVRAPFFIVLPFISAGFSCDAGAFPTWVLISWNHLAETLFVAAYFILLLFWADFHSLLIGQNISFLKKRFWFIVVFTSSIVLLNLALVTLAALFYYLASSCLLAEEHVTLIDNSWALLNGVLFLAMSAGFALYGYRLRYEMKQHIALGIKLRETGAKPIVVIGIICTLCFLGRAFVNFYSVYVSFSHWPSMSNNFNLPWWGVMLFYSFTEILPTILMLILLGHLPKKTSVHHMGSSAHVPSFFTTDRPNSTFVSSVNFPHSSGEYRKW